MLFAVWLCVRVWTFCVSVYIAGEDGKKESEKKVRTEANIQKTGDGQKTVKVTPLNADKYRSVRSKRRVKGEGKPAHVVLFWDSFRVKCAILPVWCLAFSVCLRLFWLFISFYLRFYAHEVISHFINIIIARFGDIRAKIL